jgi:acetyl esterase/lipase
MPGPVVPDRVHIHAGIEYAAVLGYRPLQLDLYRPGPGASPGQAWPVVLFLHGGGWGLGSRTGVGPVFDDWQPSFFERLAQAGFAVASADYRLSGEAHFPAQLHDAKAAVRWLRRNAGEYGLAGDRIVAWGASAGGHLAALLGLTGDVPGLEGSVGEERLPGPPRPGSGRPGPGAGCPDQPPVSSKVAAVVDWYGPTDLLAMDDQSDGTGPFRHDSPDSPESRLIGGRLSDLPGLAQMASPVSHVWPGAPPFLIMHGTADHAVPLAQSQSLADALAVAGRPAETAWIGGSDHMWLGAPDVEEIFAASVDFARRATSAPEGSVPRG